MSCGVPRGVLTGRALPSRASRLTDDLMTDDDAQRHGVGAQSGQMGIGAADSKRETAAWVVSIRCAICFCVSPWFLRAATRSLKS